MADQEVILKIGADVDSAKKDLEQVKKGVQDIGKASEETAKATGGIKKGISGVGVALKAAGIGLALKAFEMLSDVFMKNQKTADFFSTAFEVVSIALNDFVNFIFNNTGGVVDFFKAIFENPLENIKALGNAIKDNVIERFNSLIEMSGHLAKAMLAVFRGDFKGAIDSAKEAGAEFVDVLTGVDGSAEKIKDTIGGAVDAVVEYTKETVKSAQANVQLEKAANKAQAQIQGLIEKYDRQAEKLRQVRDDENATFADRIKANEDLGKVLEQQREQMLALAQTEVKRAQVQFDKLKNDENEIALIEAKNELAAIEAQITGFQSEQLTNQVSLERELAEVKKEILLEGIDARQREIVEVNNHYDEMVRLAKKAGLDITNIEKQRAAAIALIHAAEQEVRLQQTSDVAGQIADIAGKETEFGKAASLAQATINTYQGATKAIADIPFPFGGIAAGLTIVQGLQSVHQILSVEAPTPTFASGGMVGGFGTGTSDSISARLSKGESVINARSTRMFKPLLSQINQAGGGLGFDEGGLDSGSGGNTMGVVKAYVVADDMTKTQDRLAKIRRKATI